MSIAINVLEIIAGVAMMLFVRKVLFGGGGREHRCGWFR